MKNEISYDDAYWLVTSDVDVSKEFEIWLASFGRKPWDWSDSELGEFFRDHGYNTIF